MDVFCIKLNHLIPCLSQNNGGGEDGMLCVVHHVYCSMQQCSGYVMVVSSCMQ